MRNPLGKRLLRELRSNVGKYVAIVLLMIATIAVVSSILVTSTSIESTYDENFEKLKIEDGRFLVDEELSEVAFTHLSDLGVSAYANYYKDISWNETTLRTYIEREFIDQVEVMSGKLPDGEDEIAIDRLYASKNELKVGDEIMLHDRNYTISGLVALSDYSSLFKNNMDIMMDAFHFGVAIVSADTFEGIEADVCFNYSYLNADKSLSLKEQKELSKKVVESLVKDGSHVSSIYIQDENQSIKFLKDDFGSDVPMVKVLLVLIIIVISFVFTILTKSTIEEESAIIGTLLASGYTKREILTHYLEAPFMVTALSAIIGNLLGYTVMLKPVEDLFYASYSLPPCNIRFNVEAFMLTSIIPILIMLVINIVTLRYKLRLTPLQFLRRELGKKKDRKAIRLPNTSFLNRFHLRVIIQNKNNYIILFIGVFLASTLLLFGLGLNPVVDDYINSIDENIIAEYQYILKYPVEIDVEVAEKYNLCSLETYYKPTDKNLEIVVYGMEEGSKFLKDTDLTAGSNHIYASEGFLKKFGYDVGSTIEFSNPYTEKNYNLTIYGSYNFPGSFALFMNLDDYNQLFDQEEGTFRGYFSNEELEIDENYVASTITAKEMNSLGKQMMSSFEGMIPIIVGLALIIYFVFMYILTKVVIDKNTIFISYMKVFGYEDKEINRLYLRTTTLVVSCSLILCLPLETLAIKKCLELAMIKVNGYFEMNIPLYLLIEIACIGLVTYFVINFFHVLRIKKINMAAALKARE